MADQSYRFGPFELSVGRRALLREGVDVTVGSRAFDLLLALLRRAGETMTKAELLNEVWPGMAVAENNLTVQLAALRRVLGDDPLSAQSIIQTVPGRGYRLVAPVTVVESQSAPPSGPEPPHNLPAALTRLIGRERQVEELRASLLRERLVTVVGPGGMGKTSTAIAAARAALPELPDGAWLVELAAYTDPAMVPTAIADTLDVTTERGVPLAGIVDALRTQRTLLILDNCEHVAGGVARAAELLLRGCAGLRILATSREPLGCEGEAVHRLPSLDLPGPADGPISARGALEASAVRLFVERAAAAAARFSLTDADAPVVTEICRRLDGIPLAIELVAARLTTLRPVQILERMGTGFALAVPGRRTAAPRQQTLRATLEWSYGLLDEADRTLVRQLSAFAGSFCADAARAVAGEADRAGDMELRLGGLADRSLLVPEPQGPEPRFSLLETTRAYAAEARGASGDPDPMPRLARWILHRLAEAAEAWNVADEAEWIARYAPEVDDVRAVLRWAFHGEADSGLGVELASLAPCLWSELTLATEHGQWMEVALARIAPDVPSVVAGRLWLARTDWHALGDPQPLGAAEKAAALFRMAGDAAGEARAHLAAAFALMSGPATLDAVERHLSRAAALLAGGLPGRALGQLLRLRGIAGWYGGRFAESRRCFAEALEIFAHLGSRGPWAATLGSLAQRQFASGRPEDAEATVRRALDGLPARMARSGVTIHLKGLLSSYRIARGDVRGAAMLARDTLLAAQARGLRHEFAWAAERSAAVGEGLAPEEAVRLLGYADAVYAVSGRIRPDPTVDRYDRALRRLTARLGTARVMVLLSEGAALSEPEALARAAELAERASRQA